MLGQQVNEARFQAIFEQAAVGICQMTVTGHYVTANKRYCNILGYSQSELLKCTFEQITHPDDLKASQAAVEQLLTEQTSTALLEKRYIRKDGQVRWTKVSLSLVQDALQSSPYIICVLEDIDDRKQAEATLYESQQQMTIAASGHKRAEEALRESEERFRSIFEQAAVGMTLADSQSARYLRVNQRFCEMLGYSEAELLHLTWQQVTHPDDLALDFARDSPMLAGEIPSYSIEKRYLRKDETSQWVNITVSPVRDSEGTPKYEICIIEDIQDRKRAEEALRESEERFRQLAENIDAVFWVFSLNEQCVVYRSPAYETIWGRSSQTSDKETIQCWLNYVHPDDYAQVLDFLAQQNQGKQVEAVYRIIKPDNSIRWIRDRAFPVHDAQGRFYRTTGIAEDITSSKRAEEQLQASLREKEALLKEVHHRVKNNLQVVCSLLDLQSQRVREPELLSVFRNNQNRVRAMALIHERLYRSTSLVKVNFAEYIHSLMLYLIQTYAIQADNVMLQLDVEPVTLSIDTATPCGLILNELTSNALKHGFANNTSGTIWVEFKRRHALKASEPQFELIIGNDGLSLSKPPDLSRATSLGFQIVYALVEQLNGQIEVNCSRGTEFSLRFSEVEASDIL